MKPDKYLFNLAKGKSKYQGLKSYDLHGERMMNTKRCLWRALFYCAVFLSACSTGSQPETMELQSTTAPLVDEINEISATPSQVVPEPTSTALPKTQISLLTPTKLSPHTPTATEAPLSPTPITPADLSLPIIIDHTTDDINAIPQAWIETAKQTLHIAYGHTSHGRQIIHGMRGLVNFANKGGLGLSLPENIFRFDPEGNNGGTRLHLFEGSARDESGELSYDVGYIEWIQRTYDYLGAADSTTGRGTNHPEINVLMWAWCGQVSKITEESMLTDYLLPMTQLELDYPGIIFVYMTGHADGSGESGNLHLRNQQIRQYVIENKKVLYDFYDFDIHGPDDVYYGDKAVDDHLNYDSNSDGTRDRNWGLEWQAAHTEKVEWYPLGCDHTEAINCNQKAYGAWWLWARLAGWNP
jgi:hypothetical protein